MSLQSKEPSEAPAAPDKVKWFVCGAGGKRDRNGLPDRIYVCPAMGCDWFEIYERKALQPADKGE